MTESTTKKLDYVVGEHPDLLPPGLSTGILGWIYQKLFSSVFNTILTLASLYLLWLLIPGLIQWAILDSVLIADSRKACVEVDSGACWAFVTKFSGLFIYGFYPEVERWRADLSFILFFVAVAPVLFDNIPHRGKFLIFSLLYPFIAGWLIVGGWGLEYVPSDKYGGFLLTMIIGVTGITFSLPLGILLALGRNSDMPALKMICVTFIEFIRGVPLITLLFVASTMLSYFLPPGTNFDILLRVLIMVTLFSSAYVAEVIRGGLAAIPNGQREAGESLGLGYWQSMRLVILPQALKISIPGIVNTFIGLYKDTTLVIVIGMMDPLGIARFSLSNSKWMGLSTEVYLFVALFFFASCFSMARYSIYLEKKLHTGH